MSYSQVKQVLLASVIQDIQCARSQCKLVDSFSNIGKLCIRILHRRGKVRIDTYHGIKYAVFIKN